MHTPPSERHPPPPRAKARLASTLPWLLALAGCAAESGLDAPHVAHAALTDGVDDAGEADDPSTMVLHGPDEAYVAEVRAKGSACKAPKRDWYAHLSADGTRIILTFSSYEVEVGEDARRQRAGCAFEIALRSDTPQSYAVEVGGRVYSYSEEGVRGDVAMDYGFRRKALETLRVRRSGPLDDHIVLDDLSPKTVSACGTSQQLDLRTQLAITRTRAGGLGYIIASAVEVKNAPQLEVALTATPCTP